MTTIQQDFDRIARLSNDGWDHNVHYHNFLLKQIPAPCRSTLEIGCGAGAFARLLSKHSDQVLALDLSPCMIDTARERSQTYTNIEYQVADVTQWKFPTGAFDFVASIATMHHLPFDETLQKMRAALRPGGVLAILDLYKASGWRERLFGAAAFPVSVTLKLVRTGRLREAPEVQQAWAEHGRHDIYPTLATIREVSKRTLPRAQVRVHLLWRYSVVWKKN